MGPSRRIVELHGRTIGVQSDPSRGTCFAFTLPAAGRSAGFNAPVPTD